MLEKFISQANKSLLGRLLAENFKQQAPWYAIAIVSMLIVASMTSASAWIIRDIVNESVVSRDLHKIMIIAGVVAGIFSVKGIASYVQDVRAAVQKSATVAAE